MSNPHILKTTPSTGYELIDSGEGEKLERFGSVVLSRPDPQALWRKRMPVADWKKADGHFDRESGGSGDRGSWKLKQGTPDRWDISLADLKFTIKPTPFKHVGLFPEQVSNWTWMREMIQNRKEGVEVLNLFGYTGGATLACAQAGAKVVHVDGSKAAISWARENAELSGLKDKPVRWILDDARAFVKREIKRGRVYHGIIMDPPAFGHGADNEVWKIEEDLLDLIDSCSKILADKPLFFLINGYSAGYSALAYENNLLPLKARYGGQIEVGELALKEKGDDGRLLPCGIFARWSLEV